MNQEMDQPQKVIPLGHYDRQFYVPVPKEALTTWRDAGGALLIVLALVGLFFLLMVLAS